MYLLYFNSTQIELLLLRLTISTKKATRRVAVVIVILKKEGFVCIFWRK